MKIFNENEKRSLEQIKKDLEWNVDYHQEKLAEYQSKLNAIGKIEYKT